MPEDQTGFLVRHLVETTWPSVVVLAFAAAVVGWIAVQRDDRRTLAVAGVLAVLSIGVGLVGSLVETEREQALAATRAFVQDAVDGDVRSLVASLPGGKLTAALAARLAKERNGGRRLRGLCIRMVAF